MDIDKKEKIKKVCFWTLNIFSYILSALFILFLLIGLNGGGVKSPSKKSFRINDNISQPYYLSIDDSDTITLTSNETQQCLQHFYDYLDNGDEFGGIALRFDNKYLEFSEVNSSSVVYLTSDSTYGIYFILNSTDYFGEGNEAKPYNYFFIDGNDQFLDKDLEIVDDGLINPQALYEALQQDLIYADNHSFIINIFSSITNSIIDFVVTINSGLVSIVALFWVGGNLTTLGILTTIVVAVSLSYFLLRLIFGLIRLRG